jgi:hypothetical protein
MSSLGFPGQERPGFTAFMNKKIWDIVKDPGLLGKTQVFPLHKWSTNSTGTSGGLLNLVRLSLEATSHKTGLQPSSLRFVLAFFKVL